MISPTTSEVLDFALDLASAADLVSTGYYRGDLSVREKADGTLVTRADTEVETMLRRMIGERFPGHAVLGEEAGYSAGEEGAPRWVIDPIDGTHNFARSIPVWATLIAFERDGVIEVGVVSAPALLTSWYAARGTGAHRRSGLGGSDAERVEGIHVSDRASISESQILYGSYVLTLDGWGGRADALLRDARRTRGLGDFWGHCLVAEGSAEVMLEGEISPWDIAAIVPIIEEAGGRLTDIEGNATIDAGHCITTNGALHDEVLRRLRG